MYPRPHLFDNRPRHNHNPRWRLNPQDSQSRWNSARPRPSTSHFNLPSNYSGNAHHISINTDTQNNNNNNHRYNSSNSRRSSETAHQQDKPFTIIMPPQESSNFTSFTNERNKNNNNHRGNNANNSRRNIETAHQDKPFTIIMPPQESSNFTSFTNESNKNNNYNIRHLNNASNSRRNNETAHQKDKAFTIIMPPQESSNFTIVTNENNDFDQFTVPKKASSKKRDIYSQLSLKQSNFFIFASKTSSDVLKMSFLYAVARMIYECETDEELIPAIAAAEYAADFLPDDRRLFGSKADAYFKKVMAKAVRDPNFILKVQPNKRLYKTLVEFGLPPVYPTPQPVQLEGDQYMRILQILSTSLDPAYNDCDLVISLTAIAPCLQLDSVAESFLRRLQRTVHQELQKEIVLSMKSTDIFFQQYLKDASEEEVEQMLVCWRLTIPETAEKLKSLLKRLAGNGLLPITLIGRALAECSDFPWRDTFDMYPEDWTAVDLAIRQINNDPFYGYRRDKSDAVHPCHYQNLAWLAKQLCVAKLEDDYPDLDMWVTEPEHAERARRLVAVYVADSHEKNAAMDET